jgi:hypothetical protein
MSHPSSPAKPPGEDFVLWPEAPGTGPRVVNEAAIRSSLTGLAPEAWVADEEPEAPPPVVAESGAVKEERFYPASRQWFRTTAALPAGDGLGKWWQEEPALPAVSSPSGPPPAAIEKPRSEGQGPASPATGLLSPEEIWELAADELEQASRLGAPAAERVRGVPLSPTVGTAAASAPVPVAPPPASELPDSDHPPVPAPVEPLAAIPVVRAPIALRAEATGSPVPVDRRAGVPDPSPSLFKDLGAPPEPVSAFPQIKPTSGAPMEPAVREPGFKEPAFKEPAPNEPAVDQAPAVEGESRRRRERKERRRRSNPVRRRRAWGRWVLGLVGLFLVLAGATAMVARDQLPPEWRESATRWWHKAHQLVFPHQYGYPKRGVQPRAGQSAPSDVPAGERPTELDAGVEPAPSLEGSSEKRDPSVADAVPDVGATGSEGASAPPTSVVESPALSVAPDNSVPMPVLRAEPVDENPEIEIPEAPVAPAPGEVGPGAPVPEATPPEPPPSEASASASPAAEFAPGSETSPAAVATGPPLPATGVFTLWEGDSPPEAASEPASPESSATASSAAAEATGVEVAEALKAVRQLIAARTVAEVLPCIFDATALESTVREYHGRHPLQPLADAVVEHQYSGVIPATGRKAHIFNVLNPAHPRGFPVSAEQTPDGYRIDWQSYIQWRDTWLRRFIQSDSTDPQSLFVVLRRTHYFNDDVPNLDDKFAFKITSAVPDDEGAIAFVEKNSAIGRSLAELYEWRTLYFPVVELQWVSSGKESRYLRLNRIVRSSWRRVGE